MRWQNEATPVQCCQWESDAVTCAEGACERVWARVCLCPFVKGERAPAWVRICVPPSLMEPGGHTTQSPSGLWHTSSCLSFRVLPFLRFGRFFCKYKFKRLRRTVMPIHSYRLRHILSNQEIHEVSPAAYEWFADRSVGSVAASFEDSCNLCFEPSLGPQQRQ